MRIEIDLSKGREVFKTIEAMNLATVSIPFTNYWPCDNKKITDPLDFGIIKSKDYCRTESCIQISCPQIISQ